MSNPLNQNPLANPDKADARKDLKNRIYFKLMVLKLTDSGVKDPETVAANLIGYVADSTTFRADYAEMLEIEK